MSRTGQKKLFLYVCELYEQKIKSNARKLKIGAERVLNMFRESK